MYEYEIINNHTGEESIIFGYSFTDACRRSNLNPNDWSCWLQTYID